jgi:hypothetical protein
MHGAAPRGMVAVPPTYRVVRLRGLGQGLGPFEKVYSHNPHLEFTLGHGFEIRPGKSFLHNLNHKIIISCDQNLLKQYVLA